jgi:NAD(P)-dependent dehydrogenase (short-subunit alcohol dehydrogenase family)
VKISGTNAFIAGGASGLGEATARALAGAGANVVIADLNAEKGEALANEIGGAFAPVDVTKTEQIEAAIEQALELGPLWAAVNSAGIGWAQRTIGKDGEFGSAHDIDAFKKVIAINLIGTFDTIRLAATAMSRHEPDADGQRGAIVNMASVAAFDGQIGQAAYSASKGGVVGLTLPAARDLARMGVRVCTIAPGIFDTPLLAALPEENRKALGESVPFPSRLGQPREYAELACHIAENAMLNGETIRLDGALRMPPK